MLWFLICIKLFRNLSLSFACLGLKFQKLFQIYSHLFVILYSFFVSFQVRLLLCRHAFVFMSLAKIVCVHSTWSNKSLRVMADGDILDEFMSYFYSICLTLMFVSSSFEATILVH